MTTTTTTKNLHPFFLAVIAACGPDLTVHPEEIAAARRDYPRWQAEDFCPWCAQGGGYAHVVVYPRQADGLVRRAGAHAGFVHAAHLSCLPESLRQDVAAIYNALTTTTDEAGDPCCRSCFAAVGEEPAGECEEAICSSCWTKIEGSEMQAAERDAGFTAAAAE